MNIEKKVSGKELAERKKEDEKVTKLNDEAYKDKNIKDIKTEKVEYHDSKNHKREKVIEHVTYQNGVIKSRLISIYKNGKLIYHVAPKTKGQKGKRK